MTAFRAAAGTWRLPVDAREVWAAIGAASVAGAIVGLGSGDVRAFAFSLVSGLLLGLFLPAAIPFLYALLVVTIPVHVLTEEVTGIPYLGGGKWGFTKLHPATIVILVAAVVYRVSNRRRWSAAANLTGGVTWIRRGVLLFVAGVLVLSAARQHAGGIIQVVENYLGPLTLFILMVAEYEGRPRRIAMLTGFFVAIVTVVGVYGIVEYGLRHNSLYGSLYAASPLAESWYAVSNDPRSYRITTTLGHPLTNAQYFLLAATLAAGALDGAVGLRRTLAVVALPVLVAAAMATGARVTLVVLAVVPVLVMVLSRRVRALGWAVVFGGLVLVAAAYSPYGDVLRQRFTTEEGTKSTEVRERSLELIPEMLQRANLLTGDRLGRSSELSSEMLVTKQQVGFENPWLMLFVDVGAPLATLYLLVVLGLLGSVVCAAWRSRDPAVIYPAIGTVAMVLMYSSYNSFGSKNTVNYLMWFSAAVALCAAKSGKGAVGGQLGGRGANGERQ